jgi:hypothetical protein
MLTDRLAWSVRTDIESVDDISMAHISLVHTIIDLVADESQQGNETCKTVLERMRDAIDSSLRVELS